MAAKNKHEKILARKRVRLVDTKGQPLKLLSYQEAMDLVRLQRRKGDYGVGTYYLQQISEQVSEVSEPTVYLLSVYLDWMVLDEAAKLAVLLRDRFPVDSFALRALARFHQTIGELDEAEAIMLRAVQVSPNNAYNLEMLGEFYQTTGDIKKSLDYYEQALRADHYHCEALFGKARMLGAKATPEFVAQVKSAIESRKFSGVRLASLQFAMAFLYADTDIDKHFTYLHAANFSMKSTRFFDVPAYKKMADNVLYRFRHSVIDALRSVIEDDFKPIFVVGMARSGTTLLEQIMGAHSQCWPLGEDGAFTRARDDAEKLGCPSLDASSPQALEKCREYFLRINHGFKNDRLVAAVGDKSPVTKTLGYHMLLGLVFLTMPNARVIHVERHPLAIIYSCYQQNFSAGNNFSFDLEWAAEYYKVYAVLMAHWKAVFPGKILTVRYEELVRNKKQEVERILNFCDLEWDEACLEHEKSVGKVMTSSDIQVRQAVYQSSAEKWRKVEPYLESSKKTLGEWLEYSH